jgi:hypothetical protein
MNYDLIHYFSLTRSREMEPRAGAETSVYWLQPNVSAPCGSGSTTLLLSFGSSCLAFFPFQINSRESRRQEIGGSRPQLSQAELREKAANTAAAISQVVNRLRMADR